MNMIIGVITGLLKLIVKILLLPVVLVLTVVQLAGTVAVGLSSWIFDFLGCLFILTGIFSYGFGWDPVAEMWRLIVIGAGFCAFPIIAGWLIVKIAVLNMQVKIWIAS